MEAGLRVVRGPDWVWGGQDGGEGCVGTVVKPGNSVQTVVCNNCVFVLWDCGQLANYRIGLNNYYDLRVVNTAQIGARHSGISCSVCRKNDFAGLRWKCAKCSNYNLCDHCYCSDQHDLNHSFSRFDLPDSEGFPVPLRSGSAKAQKIGIYAGSTVIRGPDWRWGDQDGGIGNVGLVCEVISKEDSQYLESWCRVTWEKAGSNEYRRGHEGSLDLSYILPASGGFYYPDHLACLGKELKLRKDNARGSSSDGSKSSEEIQVDDRVRVCLDASVFEALQEGHGGWDDMMAKCIGKRGRVISKMGCGDFMVQFKGFTKPWRINPVAISREPLRSERPEDGPSSSSSSSENEDGGIHLMTFAADHLVEVAERGAAMCVRQILAQHPNQVDVRNCGKTALHMACLRGHTEVIEILVQFGADLLAQDDEGDMPVHFAVLENRTESLEKLIAFGVDVNVVNNNLVTPLHIASFKGFRKCVEILLQNNVAVNVQDRTGDTPLHEVISQNYNEIVDLFLNIPSVDLTLKNARGFNALHQAAMSGNAHATDSILRRASDLVNVQNEDGMTPLHIAAKNGHRNVVEALISQGRAELDVRNVVGHTPLHVAILHSKISVVEVLVTKGADVNVADNSGSTCLHLILDQMKSEYLSKNPKEQKLPCVDDAPHITDIRDGMPPDLKRNHFLHVAVFLVRNNADLQKANTSGKRPVDLIADAPRIIAQTLLLQNSPSECSECLMCSNKPVEVKFQPCGHGIVCRDCGRRMKNCFACKKTIEGRVPFNPPVSRQDSTVICTICNENVKNVVFLCGHGSCNDCCKKLTECHVCRRSTVNFIVLFDRDA